MLVRAGAQCMRTWRCAHPPIYSPRRSDTDLTTAPIARTMRSMITSQRRTRKLVRVLLIERCRCGRLLVGVAMFYIGSNVMDWPLEAQRAVTDGASAY